MILTVLAGFALLYLGFGAVISVLIYRDAKQAELDGPRKWAAFVLLTGGIGFLLYLSEKDTAVHDPADADPFSLPGSSTDTTSTDTETGTGTGTDADSTTNTDTDTTTDQQHDTAE
ncbi:hypothetical protein [Natrialba taiwanensis]|uniref:Cardiolipin synthase N-terminal domain-containing protein n=1 Tax=Natrialba taiwanensis DSM 12281 TaxID=1230458 RepID=L9ZFM3_9EURY|nr:hypothetical protein [Natrialba taiwanensis]ELY84846.1 hypothetical protein C484_21903 [Natrialba taiwanensis DSM 12281]